MARVEPDELGVGGLLRQRPCVVRQGWGGHGHGHDVRSPDRLVQGVGQHGQGCEPVDGAAHRQAPGLTDRLEAGQGPVADPDVVAPEGEVSGEGTADVARSYDGDGGRRAHSPAERTQTVVSKPEWQAAASVVLILGDAHRLLAPLPPGEGDEGDDRPAHEHQGQEDLDGQAGRSPMGQNGAHLCITGPK